VRTVNSTMVLAYWHVGREIVEFVQRGAKRAEYGERLSDDPHAGLPLVAPPRRSWNAFAAATVAGLLAARDPLGKVGLRQPEPPSSLVTQRGER
jgi:hypothetical protein